ncbi:hypothetical protein L546_1967 [Bordetella pertussis H897]|nr:hypothetical protein L546_1967 [Bordetella pertussis H897]
MNWGGGDFQFLKSGSDEPCIQPIESSQLDPVQRVSQETRAQREMDGDPVPALQDRRGPLAAHQARQQTGMRQQQAHRPQRQEKQDPERVRPVAVAVTRGLVERDGDRPGRERQHAQDETDPVIERQGGLLLLEC